MNPAQTVAVVLLAGGLTLGSVAVGLFPAGTPAASAEAQGEDSRSLEGFCSPVTNESVSSPALGDACLGDVRLDDPEVRWVDVANVAASNMSGHVNVSLSWPETDEADGQQFWMCAYRGRNWRPLKGEDLEDRGPGSMMCLKRIGDDRLHVRVRGAGQEVSESAVNPYWAVDNERWRVWEKWGFLNWSDMRNGSVNAPDNLTKEDRPVVHTMFVWGGAPFDRVHVNVTWEGTQVNVTHGTGGVFAYQPHDFDSDVYAQVDGPYAHGLVAHSEASLETRLVRDRPFTVFWFFPTYDYSMSEAWYERPDGTEYRHPFGWPVMSEVTTMPGPWRFHVGTSYQDNNHMPILIGAEYERARLPWETWTVPAS